MPEQGGQGGANAPPPCPLAEGASGAKVLFRFITADLINCKLMYQFGKWELR